MNVTFEFCSFQYLKLWENHDRNCHKILTDNNSTENDKLSALKKAGTFYRVARNLPTKYDHPRRYGPVLDILEEITKENFKEHPNNTVNTILDIEKNISQKYGDRGVLSLTTKFLWLKVKQPVIIYDSRARIALGTQNGDLGAFYNKWYEEFKKVKSKIERACQNLENLHLYLPNQRENLKEEIKKISNESWFHERVFDTYLWNKGNV
jgi:hypothetical protein